MTLVLSDMKMLGLSGEKLLEKVKQILFSSCFMRKEFGLETAGIEAIVAFTFEGKAFRAE